jgi:hypothetical protein
MVTHQQFQTLSQQEQKEYLISLIGDIETETNQALLLCQKLLDSIELPSLQLLDYIFAVIEGQLQQKVEDNQERLAILTSYIKEQSDKDAENAEAVLSELDFIS